jgi:hypothetical protein
MNPSDFLKLPAGLDGRFSIVDYLPTAGGVLGLLVLFWARSGDQLSFRQAWRTAEALSFRQIMLLAVAVLFAALLIHPFQLRIIRLLEGDWPRWLGWAGRPFGYWNRWRMARLERKTVVVVDQASDLDAVRAAGEASIRLRLRYPMAEHLIRPTRLGNALAAMEYRSGRDYGLDAVVAWPRLYTVLSEQVKAVVDDRRDSLDIAGRLAVTAFVLGLVAVIPLWGTGLWLLLLLVPVLVSRLSYLACVQAAMAYGEAVQVAFDLHRFDLLRSCHVALPENPRTEQALNRGLCDLWRQGAPLPAELRYDHPDQESAR